MIRTDIIAFRFINDLAGQNRVADATGFFLAEALIYVICGAALLPAGWDIVRLRVTPREAKKIASDTVVALHAAITAALSLVGNYLFSLWMFRPRPFVVLHDVHQLVAISPSFKSFPSDHTSLAFAVAFSVFFFRRRIGALLLFLATLVGFGRVFVGVHYPTDIVAGIGVGFGWAVVVISVGKGLKDHERLASMFLRRMKKFKIKNI